MKLLFIAPICALNEISLLGDMDFVLAPYCKDLKYKQYFIDAKKKGRYIIMDNGISESNLIPNKELVELTIEMKIDELIIPDVIGDYQKTKEMREEFLTEYYDLLNAHNIKLQSVIQGNTFHEYLQSIFDLEEDDRIDVIGIPFKINYCTFNKMTKNENQMWNRLLFLDYLAPTKPIHLLGNNLAAELCWAIHPNIRSSDSKLMARYGLNKQFWKFDDSDKPKKKLYVHSKMTLKQIEIAIRNINMLKRELDGQ